MKDANNRNIIQSCFDIIEEEKYNLAHEIYNEIKRGLHAMRDTAHDISNQHHTNHPQYMAEKIVVLTDDMLDTLKGILRRLSPTTMGKLGILDALSDLVQFNREQFHLECGIHTEGSLESLPIAIKLTIYRMAQESLSNAVHHGDANHANIQIARENKTLRITIENNGKPLDDKGLKNPGIGILSMRERVHAFGGELHIQNMPSGGVMVHATLPLETIH